MDNFSFIEEKKTVGQWMKEHRSGLYLTVIFHLIILILMAVQGIRGQMDNQSVFVFDFSREEAELARLEEEIKQLEEKEEIKQEVDEMIRQVLATNTPRNVAVNTADAREAEIRKTSGESQSIFDEAKALQERLDATRRQIEDQQGADNIPIASGNDATEDKQENKQTYTGPSVLSYTLDGRKAVSLPVPVYKCPGGGDVTINIVVNRQGYVIDASVDKGASENNNCLHEAALNAAKRSRFNNTPSAPDKQEGEIVYRFIAQ